MGGTEHRRSQGELRKAVAWCGAVVDHAAGSIAQAHGGWRWAAANAPNGAVCALSLPVR